MKNIKFIYIILFGSIIGWAIFAYITTTEIIQSQSQYARLINISGKQRMLSQQIALMCMRYDKEKDQSTKQHLESLYQAMKQAHQDLIHNKIHFDAIDTIYYSKEYDLDNKVSHYLKLVSDFINEPGASLLEKIQTASFALLPLLDEAVSSYETESNNNTYQLMEREAFILMGILITLFLEAIFIIFPVMRLATCRESNLKSLVKQRTKELEELSITDQLTSLFNRREIDKRLKNELDKSQRYASSFSLVMIDIDYFKSINDTYGHQVGDDVLKSVARLLSDNIRKTDTLGRWGGEEFIIINTESDPHKVLGFVEKLRSTIEGHQFSNIQGLTCSFGVAHSIAGDTPSSILKRADKALYLAKDSGRNCIKEYL